MAIPKCANGGYRARAPIPTTRTGHWEKPVPGKKTGPSQANIVEHAIHNAGLSKSKGTANVSVNIDNINVNTTKPNYKPAKVARAHIGETFVIDIGTNDLAVEAHPGQKSVIESRPATAVFSIDNSDDIEVLTRIEINNFTRVTIINENGCNIPLPEIFALNVAPSKRPYMSSGQTSSRGSGVLKVAKNPHYLRRMSPEDSEVDNTRRTLERATICQPISASPDCLSLSAGGIFCGRVASDLMDVDSTIDRVGGVDSNSPHRAKEIDQAARERFRLMLERLNRLGPSPSFGPAEPKAGNTDTPKDDGIAHPADAGASSEGYTLVNNKVVASLQANDPAIIIARAKSPGAAPVCGKREEIDNLYQQQVAWQHANGARVSGDSGYASTWSKKDKPTSNYDTGTGVKILAHTPEDSGFESPSKKLNPKAIEFRSIGRSDEKLVLGTTERTSSKLPQSHIDKAFPGFDVTNLRPTSPPSALQPRNSHLDGYDDATYPPPGFPPALEPSPPPSCSGQANIPGFGPGPPRMVSSSVWPSTRPLSTPIHPLAPVMSGTTGPTPFSSYNPCPYVPAPPMNPSHPLPSNPLGAFPAGFPPLTAFTTTPFVGSGSVFPPVGLPFLPHCLAQSRPGPQASQYIRTVLPPSNLSFDNSTYPAPHHQPTDRQSPTINMNIAPPVPRAGPHHIVGIDPWTRHPQRPRFPVIKKPRDNDPIKQQQYEEYLEWRKTFEPGFHVAAKVRQANRILRQKQGQRVAPSQSEPTNVT